MLARHVLCVVIGCAMVSSVAEQSVRAQTKPEISVPRLQVVPQPHDQDSFQLDGRELTRLHRAADQQRPFLFPIVGPSGRSLTRMGHPHDPVSHSHHNSFWVSHHDVNGVDFWGDKGAGRILTTSVDYYDDSDTAAVTQIVNAWRDSSGNTLLTERRRISVSTLDHNNWLLTLDLEFTAAKEPVTFGKTPFGLVGVRMAKTIGVRDGGGTIRNSAGQTNEKEVFWKPARWCDYSGPIAPGHVEGVALFDHPSNPNYPTVFHVRDDGWMGASLTFDGPRTVEPTKPLRLRYALYVHADAPSIESIDGYWKRFALTSIPDTLLPAKKK